MIYQINDLQIYTKINQRAGFEQQQCNLNMAASNTANLNHLILEKTIAIVEQQ